MIRCVADGIKNVDFKRGFASLRVFEAQKSRDVKSRPKAAGERELLMRRGKASD